MQYRCHRVCTVLNAADGIIYVFLVENQVSSTELQKRILELSSSLVATDNADEFRQLASELRKALRDHSAKLRAIIGETRKNIAQKSGALAPHNRTSNRRIEQIVK
jgi:hypothetical protein